MRDLNGTDVKMLAKGYWDNYFNWRIHPRAKLALIVAGVTIALLVVMLVSAMGMDPMPVALRVLSLLTFVAFTISALWTVFVSLRERDHFLDGVQHLWETSKAVPDRTTVIDFVITGVLKGRK